MNGKQLFACIGMTLAFGLLSARSAETKVASAAQLPPASAKEGVTYATDIQPIFEKSCVRCHGAEKAKGRLRLDSLAGALKGGEDGKVINPGKSAESMLVRNVARIGPKDSHMPPANNKANIPPLTTDQIGLIRAWIDQGAK